MRPTERPKAIDWFARPTAAGTGPTSDRAAGRLNLCYNALDRHVIRGRADDLALVAADKTFSYAELLEQVAQLGGALRELGVVVGDRVLIQLPPGPELVFSLLACSRVGAAHVAVPADAAPDVLAERADATTPKVVIGPARPQGGHRTDYCVVFGEDSSKLGPFDIGLRVLMKPGSFQPAACAEVDGDQPAVITESGWEPVGPRAQRLADAAADIAPGGQVIITGELADRLLVALFPGATAVLR